MSYDYDADFYQQVTDGAIMSAQTVVPWLVEKFDPYDIVDVGCGAGAWLSEFIKCGSMGFGIDGPWAKEHLLFDEDLFVPHDLINPLSLGDDFKKYDMAICLEVAEHLPFSRSVSLVDDLCRLSDTIVFGAATPGQGGHGHINEQPHEFWLKLFHNNHYMWDNSPQKQFKDDPNVCWWYSQNMFIFRKE